MNRHDLGVHLGIISHLRPGNVRPMQALVGPATWFVGKGEADVYRQAGAADVVEGGALCRSRNMALASAWSNDYPSMQLSDDLKRVQQITQPSMKVVPIPFAQAAASLLAGMRDARAMLAGAAVTSNKLNFNAKEPVSYGKFILGDFIIVEPCDLFFDENLRLKEDYDYTLQHLKQFERVFRMNDIMPDFVHRSNTGGACAIRTPGTEQEAIAYLKAKHPGCIVDNPKRPNEIFLRWM